MREITHIEGDCLQVMPELPRKSFDLMIADPPYAMPATYYLGRYIEKKWSDASIMQGWWRYVMDTAVPLLKDNAMALVFCNAASLVSFYPTMYQKTESLQVAIWDKIFTGMGSPLSNTAEFIIVGGIGTAYRSRKGVSNIFRYKRVSPTNRSHQAQKPTELIDDLVGLFCPPEGNVLDPFAGSGVVASVCERTGRRCTSIEWDASEHRMPQPMLMSTNGVHE